MKTEITVISVRPRMSSGVVRVPKVLRSISPVGAESGKKVINSTRKFTSPDKNILMK